MSQVGSQRSPLAALVLHAVLQLSSLPFIALALFLMWLVLPQACMLCAAEPAPSVMADEGTRPGARLNIARQSRAAFCRHTKGVAAMLHTRLPRPLRLRKRLGYGW